ncbi:hypothetical protein Tco_0570865 [Tanacetum coccineum]
MPKAGGGTDLKLDLIPSTFTYFRLRDIKEGEDEKVGEEEDVATSFDPKAVFSNLSLYMKEIGTKLPLLLHSQTWAALNTTPNEAEYAQSYKKTEIIQHSSKPRMEDIELKRLRLEEAPPVVSNPFWRRWHSKSFCMISHGEKLSFD